ncbi:TPA: 3'-5' exonuclease, partial [Acinetobacter baumannii]
IEGQPSCESFRLPEGVEFIVGHNIDYDIKALNKCGPAIKVKTICTLALARDVWPDLTSHKLAVLYYFVMSNREEARKHLRHAHSARADVYFTGIILIALIERLGIKDLNSLFLMSEAVRLPKIMTWGKHKGTPLKELPRPYISWLLNKEDLDPHLRKALQNI